MRHRSSALLRPLAAMVVASAPLWASAASAEIAPQPAGYEAWFTGPVYAATAATLPKGRVLFEPYLFDVVTTGRFDAGGHRSAVPQQQYIGSLSYLNYGLTDRFTVGLIPRFGYGAAPRSARSTRPGIGDLSVQAQYRLVNEGPADWRKTLSLNLTETLPTGRYDHLRKPADGLGSGAYTTTVAVFTQAGLGRPFGRPLRARLDLSYGFAPPVSVQDRSVYGTDPGFVGKARPGDTRVADLAFEYSLSQRWALAMDLVGERDGVTRVSGVDGAQRRVDQASGISRALFAVPAVEYNWSDTAGVIVGARVFAAGRNRGDSVMPVAAVNFIF